MHRAIFLTLLVLSLVGYGCRTTSSSLHTTFAVSPAKVREIVRDHQQSIRTMKCEGQISLESAEISQSGSFHLVVKKPDSVLIILQGPFGIKVGSALVTRQNFLFYNSLQNKLISGETSSDNLSRTLHIQVSFDDLVSLLAGGEFLEEDKRDPDQQELEGESMIFKYISSKSSRSYWIDPETSRIQKIQHYDAKRKLIREEQFTNFDETNTFTTPYTIRLTHIPSRRIVTMNYSSIQFNPTPTNCSFSYPENAEHIQW
jgi:outer membrane lipoprotein-sorting protein